MKQEKEVEPLASRWRDSVASIMEAAHLLIRARDEMPTVGFVNFARLNTGLDESAAGKLMKVGKNPVLSDPQNMDKLPNSWAFMYELSFLPEDTLRTAVENGTVLKMTKYDIWRIRAENEGGRMRRGNNGVKGGVGSIREGMVKVPNGETLEGVVRRGIVQEEGGKTPNEAARIVGIGVGSYRMVKMAIMLAANDLLSDTERATAKAALDEMNRTRNVRRHYERIEPIALRLFGADRNQSYNDERIQRRIEKFRGAVVIIHDTCLGGGDIDIPPLPREVKAEVLERLSKAREAISQLKGKVVKDND